MHARRVAFYRRAFLLGALWNLAVGLSGVLLYGLSVRLLFGPDAAAEPIVAAVGYRFFMTAVILFGIGYWMVSRDPGANRGIVWIGTAGKLAVFGAGAALFLADKVTVLFVLGGTVDLGFGLIYTAFLWETRSR